MKKTVLIILACMCNGCVILSDCDNCNVRVYKSVPVQIEARFPTSDVLC